jgi:benzodiazapine receptor
MATRIKLNHLAIPYLAIFLFIFGGIITNDGIGWYYTLTLPAWNPPTALVAVIWAVIYVCAAVSLLLVWNTALRNARFNWILAGFVGSTLLNAVWSILFFHFHLFLPAKWCAVVLGFSVLLLAILAYPVSHRAALLLLPYTLWVFFAAYLNYVVMVLNR